MAKSMRHVSAVLVATVGLAMVTPSLAAAERETEENSECDRPVAQFDT
jgi:hypothetical protein